MPLKLVAKKNLYGVSPRQSAGKLISAVISLFRNGTRTYVVLVSTNGWVRNSSPTNLTRVCSRLSDSIFISGKAENATKKYRD